MTSPTDPPARGRAEPARTPGAIILARHGEPALSRRLKLDAKGYDRWWAAYEAGGILVGQTPPVELMDQVRGVRLVITSTRLRAIETARAIAGDKPVQVEAMFVEAPLPAPQTPNFLRLTPRAWGVLSRLLWWLGHHRDQETRTQARERARAVADRLIAEAEVEDGQDVLVVAHGFFNAMVGGVLVRRGWRCVQDRGFGYWAARRFERS